MSCNSDASTSPVATSELLMATKMTGPLYMKALATVATLAHMIDMNRLIATRDAHLPKPILTVELINPDMESTEYLRFLTMRLLCEDISAEELEPPKHIEQLWQAHILDTKAYSRLQASFPDRLTYDPCRNKAEHSKGLEKTHAQYRKMFERDPFRMGAHLIWNESDSKAEPPLVGSEVTNNNTPGQHARQSLVTGDPRIDERIRQYFEFRSLQSNQQ